MLQMIHQIIKGLKSTLKKYQNVSHIFINQYNWKGIKFPSDKEDWEKFEQNNKEIALNILFVPHDKKEIPHAYISKYNHKRKNQVILLMITDGERWHYLAVRSCLHCLEEYHQVIVELFAV